MSRSKLKSLFLFLCFNNFVRAPKAYFQLQIIPGDKAIELNTVNTQHNHIVIRGRKKRSELPTHEKFQLCVARIQMMPMENEGKTRFFLMIGMTQSLGVQISIATSISVIPCETAILDLFVVKDRFPPLSWFGFSSKVSTQNFAFC